MKHMGRILAVVMSLSLLLSTSFGPKAFAADGHPFVDMQGSPYEAVVSTLYQYGIVTGLEPDKFVANGPVTRAQMAALIVRAIGKTAEADLLKTTPAAFSDVPPGHWAYGSVAYANRAGIIKGDGINFYPNEPVNYAQAATMLVRALGYENQVTGGYPSGYVLKANELGVLKNLKFELYAGVNRGEAAVFLYNAIFRAPASATGLTWSQSVFKQAKSLSLETLPTYAAPGQQVPLNAKVSDPEGNPIPDAVVAYRVVSGSAQVSNNILTVGAGGSITVEATYGALSAPATITSATNLVISPATFQASKGGMIQLTAAVTAGTVQVTVQPEWRVKSGPATVNQSGQLTINDYGDVTVEARLGSLTAAVSGQAVGKLTITQKPDYVVPGLGYDLKAVAADAAGNPIQAPITWTAVGATIDKTSGRLTNPVGDQVVVRATAGGIITEAAIPVIKSIQVTPSTATLLRGRTNVFSARAVDATGRQYEIEPRWDRSNATVGVISTDGTFVGTSSGTTAVTASLGSLTGKAQAQVSGDPVKISLTTASTTLPASTAATTTVTAKLLDQNNAFSPVSDQPITFTLTDSGRGTINKSVVLTKDGEASVTYTAGSTPGIATIMAQAPGTTLAGQTVSITTYQPIASYVQLSATPQPLAVGGGIATVMATVMDTNGQPVTATQALQVTLSTSSQVAGWLTGTVITIPAGQTKGSTTFISGAVPGTVQINGSTSLPVRGLALTTSTVGPAAKVMIRPLAGPTPVTGLSALQVQVEVQDASGVMRAADSVTPVQLVIIMPDGPQGNAPVTYNAIAANGVASFQAPAYVVGTATLRASLPNNPEALTDTETAEFIPGVFSSLRLTAQPTSAPADGYSQVQVIAEVVDRSGTVLTTVNPVVTFRKLTEAGVTTPLTGLTVQTVAGRAVLTLQTTGQAGTETWYATAPGLDTQNLATVTTSTSSGDAYGLRYMGSANFGIGTSNTITVQVVDPTGRHVTTDSGRVVVATHSIPGVTITPNTVSTLGGVATFVISGTQTASGAISFTATNLVSPTVHANISIGQSGSSGQAYKIMASGANSVRVGQSAMLLVLAMDSNSALVSGDTGRQITATVSGPAVVSPVVVTTTNGIATFTLIGTGVGQAVVTFSAPGLAQPTTQLTLTVTN